MTTVNFKFLYPDGTPIAGEKFYVTLNRAAYHSGKDGMVYPDVVEATTDPDGLATLELFPANKPYYVTMDLETETTDTSCFTSLRFRIAVPDMTTPVWADDLIVTDPIFSQPWDAEAIEVIMQAKAAAAASASEAKASEIAAAGSAIAASTSATNAAASEAVAVQKAGEASVSAVAAAGSATTASEQAGIATTKATEASASASAAAASQAAASTSETNAATSATNAAGSASAAQTSATNAATSETNAGNSATAADASADAALVSQTAAAGSATNALASENKAQAWAINPEDVPVEGTDYSSLHWAKKALAAASVVTGSLIDGGSVDLSGGAYPAEPGFSTFWKVVVGGTVTGPNGDTYGIGDTLVYSKSLDVFYKIDNTENVSSVAGKTGVVTLVKGDVGLGNADNTADSVKPVSGPQQAALDQKANISSLGTAAAANLTTSSTDTTVGRVTRVGDFGLGGNVVGIAESAIDAITYTGMFFVNSLGASKLPVQRYGYLLSQAYSAGYTNQLFLVEDGSAVYERAQTGGTWRAWKTYLLKGDMGIGGQAPGLADAAAVNALSPNDQGFYTIVGSVSAALGIPKSYGGLIMHYGRAGDTAVQHFVSTGTVDVTVCYRTYNTTASGWSPWVMNLKKGDYGVGGLGVTVLSTSINTLVESGWYYCNSANSGENLPVAVNGYLTVHAQSNLYCKQIFSHVTDGRTWERYLVNGTWQSWARMLSSNELVASSYDSTANKIVNTGAGGMWMGLGAPSLPAIASLDTIAVTCLYTFNESATGRPPAFGYGNVLTICRNANERTQIAWSVVDNSSSTRSMLNGVWTAWVREYNTTNVVGTVSNSSGVNTGAIIERGSGTAGQWTRFADGTLECWGMGTFACPVSADPVPATIAVPQPFNFVDNQFVGTAWAQPHVSWSGFSGVLACVPGTTSYFSAAIRNTSTAQNVNIGWRTIGRWR